MSSEDAGMVRSIREELKFLQTGELGLGILLTKSGKISCHVFKPCTPETDKGGSIWKATWGLSSILGNWVFKINHCV